MTKGPQGLKFGKFGKTIMGFRRNSPRDANSGDMAKQLFVIAFGNNHMCIVIIQQNEIGQTLPK